MNKKNILVILCLSLTIVISIILSYCAENDYDPSLYSYLEYSAPTIDISTFDTFYQTSRSYTAYGDDGNGSGDSKYPDLTADDFRLYGVIFNNFNSENLGQYGWNYVQDDMIREHQDVRRDLFFAYDIEIKNIGEKDVYSPITVYFYLENTQGEGEIYYIGQGMVYGGIPAGGTASSRYYLNADSFLYPTQIYDKYGYPNGSYRALCKIDPGNDAGEKAETLANNKLNSTVDFVVTESGNYEDQVTINAISPEYKNTDTFIFFYEFDLDLTGWVKNYWDGIDKYIEKTYSNISDYPSIKVADINMPILNLFDFGNYLNSRYFNIFALASYYAPMMSDSSGTDNRNAVMKRFLPKGDGVLDNGDDRDYFIRVQISPYGYSQEIGCYTLAVKSANTPVTPDCNGDILNLSPLLPSKNPAIPVYVDGDPVNANFSDISDFDWYRLVRP